MCEPPRPLLLTHRRLPDHLIALPAPPGYSMPGNGEHVCRGVLRLHPDLLLLDLRMPGLSPLDVISAVQENSPHTKILVISAFNDPNEVRLVRNAGIDGYLLKEEVPELLLTAVHTVLGGATWFSRAILETLMALGHDVAPADNPWSTLTEREQDILRCIGDGLSNRQIAHRLHLAEQTMRNYNCYSPTGEQYVCLLVSGRQVSRNRALGASGLVNSPAFSCDGVTAKLL